MAGGGGNTNVQIILKGGGGQKCPKICPHGLWMTPESDGWMILWNMCRLGLQRLLETYLTKQV